MTHVCAARAIKNARYLQANAPHLIPKTEPPQGFGSRVPRELLARLHTQVPKAELDRVPGLSAALAKTPIARPRNAASAPLFTGTLVFASIDFATRKGVVSIGPGDLTTAMDFARLASVPISRYAAQYGPNRVAVTDAAVPFTANIPGGTYNDQTLQGWVDSIVKAGGLSANTCVVILNPPGVTNTDADPGQGVGGYHGMAQVPYAFVNALGSSFTVRDEANLYALALSHEIAEMVVDPRADLGNPEVCDPCVPGSEVVLGDNKPIAEYAVGDHVVGAHGLQKVTRTYARAYRGELIEIKALGMLPFRVTPNHPLLVVPGRSEGATVTYRSRRWQEAGRVRPKLRFHDGDYLVMPRLRGNLACSEVSLTRYIREHRRGLKWTGQGAKPSSYPHAEAFPITEETAWMLGLYVAEGYANPAHRSAEFALHEDQPATVDRLRRVAQRLGHTLGVQPIPGERGVKAILCSVILCRFLPDVCGKGAAHKRIPDFILYHEDERILRAFLDGYMAGDGSIEHTQAGYEVSSFSTVSKTLALQLQLAFGRIGVFISLRRKRPAQTSVILGRRVRMHETYRGLWCSDRRATRHERVHPHGDRDAFFLPVKSISRVPFSGSVHNLETIDHTYLVSNAVTHNCGPNCQAVWIDYFNNAGGYIQTLQAFPPPFDYAFFINAMVKPASASLCPAPGGACNYAPP